VAQIFLGNYERGWVKSPPLKGHFAHRARRGFGLCLTSLQKEPRAKLMEPTGTDGL